MPVVELWMIWCSMFAPSIGIQLIFTSSDFLCICIIGSAKKNEQCSSRYLVSPLTSWCVRTFLKAKCSPFCSCICRSHHRDPTTSIKEIAKDIQFEDHPSLPQTASLHAHQAMPTVSSWHTMVGLQLILESDLHWHGWWSVLLCPYHASP